MAVETKQEELGATSTQWVQELTNPEVQDALATLLQKLPQIKEAVLKVEQGVQAASSFAMSSEALDVIAGGANQVSKLALSKENLDALMVIVDKLPRIAKSLEMLDRVTPIIEKLTNRDSLVAMSEVFGIVTEPAKEKLDSGLSIVKEAKQRAEHDTQNISIFGVLGMLKDPTVQEGLRFMRAFLDVVSEKRAAK